MLKNFDIDLKYLILLWFILLLAIIPTYAHHGNLLIDNGREVYLPTQILSGHILYKNLFNIYGPFSYMFNAFLFKIFGINLNVLYLAGCVCSFLIINLIYLISRKFLPAFVSFSISFYTISLGILTLNLFNFIFPYSYGMLYGLVAFLASVWFLLKYQEIPEKTFYLYLSSFFAGLCVINKYEFFPYLIVILYAIIRIKPLKLKEYYYAIFSLLFVPVFCLGVLFLQGMGINDLSNSVSIIKKMSQTETLKYFYQTQGTYFHKKTIWMLCNNFLRTIIPLALFIYGFKSSKKILSIIIIVSSIISMFCLITPASFAFLPILTVILAIVNFKKLRQNTALIILTLSGIALSVKVFWGLATLNYGMFFASFMLITVLALIYPSPPAPTSREQYSIVPSAESQGARVGNAVGLYVLIVATILGYQNLLTLKAKNFLISSNRGQIYTNAEFYYSTEDLINYINKNTKRTDTIVILPEGTMINFMTQRPSDNYYMSLIPLYVETFGEEKIINHFKQTKPEYIIFNNWDTSNYYFHHICEDYALAFCGFVATNYKQVKVIDKGFRYLIFKREL